MIPHRLFLVIALLGVLVAAPPAFAATPGAQLDQSQTLNDAHGAPDAGQVFGQTFTAGVSGALTDVALTLSNAGASGTVTVRITRLDGAGFPDLGAVLASATISPAQVPASATWIALSLSGPPGVTKGQRYAIVWTTTDTGNSYELYGGQPSPYAGGELYIGDGVSWFSPGDADLAFATYVLAYWFAQPSRVAYCLGTRFLDLEAGQPVTDPAYAGAVPARFVVGKGLTCDRPPAGYELSGKTTATDHVAEGIYDRYAPAG